MEQAELLNELIKKSKGDNERIEHIQNFFTAIETRAFINGVKANAKHRGELTFIDKEFSVIGVDKRPPGDTSRITEFTGEPK